MTNIRYETYKAMQDELLSTKSSASAAPEPEQPKGYLVEVHIRADDADDARGRVAGILLPYSAYTTGARRDDEGRELIQLEVEKVELIQLEVEKVIADLYDVASDAESDVLLRLRGRAGHIAEHSRDTRCRLRMEQGWHDAAERGHVAPEHGVPAFMFTEEKE